MVGCSHPTKTNLIVRLVVNDDVKQAALVRKWLEKHTSALKPVYVDHLWQSFPGNCIKPMAIQGKPSIKSSAG